MANICDFNMCVKGNKKDIESFYNAMMQKGNIYMGRGAEADINYEDDGCTAFIDGYCKWSVQSALIDNAISMRENPNGWYFGEDVDKTKLTFITLWEACKMFNVNMEVYSEECGCCFQEHYIYNNGNITEDCVDYCEYCIDEFDSKEDAERELDIEITDEEWESGWPWISRGGYEFWDFEI